MTRLSFLSLVLLPKRPPTSQRNARAFLSKNQMGCRLGRQKETVLFRHNDLQHLDETLENLLSRGAGSAPTNVFVAVESVYSMDGDLAPLTEILGVAAKHGALVIVDEAHGYACQRG